MGTRTTSTTTLASTTNMFRPVTSVSKTCQCLTVHDCVILLVEFVLYCRRGSIVMGSEVSFMSSTGKYLAAIVTQVYSGSNTFDVLDVNGDTQFRIPKKKIRLAKA